MGNRLWTAGGAVLLAALIPLAAPLGAQDAASLEGDWLGMLNAGGTQLRLLFHVTEGATLAAFKVGDVLVASCNLAVDPKD